LNKKKIVTRDDLKKILREYEFREKFGAVKAILYNTDVNEFLSVRYTFTVDWVKFGT
jgi:hypothetical protein